jgi:PEP-CTERM motif-containing protein
MHRFLIAAAVMSLISLSTSVRANLLDLDFNSGVDSFGNSAGNLVFCGPGSFSVTFTDDLTDGTLGGKANGTQITDLGFGNIKAGTGDLVLAANNDYFDATHNWHSSGIVANFSQGVDQVGFDDTDDDWTQKALFAFDQNHHIIGQTGYGTQIPFSIDTGMTGGQKIYAVEFDTIGGGGGGSIDNVYFSLDNFHVMYEPIETPVPEPATLGLLALGAGLAGLIARRKRRA